MALDASHHGTRVHPQDLDATDAIDADIEAMVHAHYDAVHRLARSILDDPAAADDAAQETFVAAAQGFASFRGDAGMKTWLFAIAINQCRSIMRKQSRRDRLRKLAAPLQGLFGSSPSPEDETARSEEAEALRKAVADLKEQHRLPILLRYVHDMTAAEIAAVLQISEGTVYSRLHYARRQLRFILER
jgi:RNA polymerase sigma-70 factor (ECF subfamily)